MTHVSHGRLELGRTGLHKALQYSASLLSSKGLGENSTHALQVGTEFGQEV